MSKHIFCDRTGRLSKHVAEYIVKFEIGYSKTILSTILLTGNHTGKFETVPNQIFKVANVSRWNKRRFDHVAHEQITDPLGVLTVSLISFLWFCILWMSKNNRNIRFFKDIKYRNPILAGRFHADVRTPVLSKPTAQFLKPFGERGKTSLLIVSSAACISNPDTGIDPGFVDI